MIPSVSTATGATNKGTDTIGTYVASSSTFFLRNSNSPGAADVTAGYGPPPSTWVPIRGDWDGDGADSIGLYDPATSTFYLKNTNAPGSADLAFAYGAGGLGYLPVAGDWNGDGIDTIGLYQPSTGGFVLRNSNSAGAADLTFSFGAGGAAMRAIAGDWNDDGVDTVGVCNTVNGTFNLRNSNTSGPTDLTFSFGAGGAMPLAGDWDGANGDSIGLYVPSTSTFQLKNTNTNGPADLAFGYGAANSLPVVGDWDGATGPGGVPRSDSRRFVYDRFGNRTAMYNSTSGVSPASQTITLQPLSGQSGVVTNRINQVTTTGVGTVTYAHDRAGNVKNDGVNAFKYDVLGRITESTTGATTSNFQYDSGNRRIQKKVGAAAAVDYIWEGGHILAEYDRASGTFTDYVWAGGRMVATVSGGTTTFLYQDRLSTRLSTNASGNVIGTQSHFPFGEDAGTSGTVERHRFTTYERDSESGTDYAVNRQHGASTGRFMRPDPMAGTASFPQSLNRYSYTINDPVTLSDPLGLNPVAPPGTYVDQFGVKYRWDGTTLWGSSYDGGTVFSGGPTRTTDDLPRPGIDGVAPGDMQWDGGGATDAWDSGPVPVDCGDFDRPRPPDARFITIGWGLGGRVTFTGGLDRYSNFYLGVDGGVSVTVLPFTFQYKETYLDGPYSSSIPDDRTLRDAIRGYSFFANGATAPVFGTDPGRNGCEIQVTSSGTVLTSDLVGTPGASAGGSLMGHWNNYGRYPNW